MRKIDCDKYWDMEKDEKNFEEWSIEELEYDYCSVKWMIEVKFNNWWEPVWLSYFISFIYAKLDLEWEDIYKLEDVDVLPRTLDYIWNLLKEKKVKVKKFTIEEYEKPKEIEKVMFWGKLRKKYTITWKWKPIWRLDPCKYKDNDKLEEDIEDWKLETFEIYKYALEKYDQSEVNLLLDILEIVRSDCYEWEIEVE